jgi:hypothetical protein
MLIDERSDAWPLVILVIHDASATKRMQRAHIGIELRFMDR